MFNVRERNKLSRNAWNRASDQIDSAWAWHRWELLEARQTWHDTADLSFAVVCSDKPTDILALVPLVLIRSANSSIAFGPYLESTGGPAISSDLPQRTQGKVRSFIARELKRLATNYSARRADISCPPLSPNLLEVHCPTPNPLCHFGASDTSTQSWVIKISNQSEDQLWRTLEHRCRKQIKKAHRNNLAAQMLVPDSSVLKEYYNLHQQTCYRNGIPPHPSEYFETIFSIVASAGLCKSCVVTKDEEILAIHNFLVYKNSALYWTTAGSSEALKLCANDLGVWHAIKELKKNAIDYIECGEAFPGAKNGKLKGLNDFKKSFGGELYPYFRGQILYRPITESLMNIARHIIKRGAGS